MNTCLYNLRANDMKMKEDNWSSKGMVAFGQKESYCREGNGGGFHKEIKQVVCI